MQQMFGKIGQNFQMKDRVVIGATGPNATGPNGIDGATGIIGGIVSEDVGGSFYIVLLDEPAANGWLATCMPEVCLARLPVSTDMETIDHMVLRTVYLSKPIDNKLRDLAFAKSISKGELLQMLIEKSLEVNIEEPLIDICTELAIKNGIHEALKEVEQ